MRRFRGLSILMAVAMLTLLFAGMAFASTGNTVRTTPSVDNDGTAVLGDLRIYEAEDEGNTFAPGDTFIITLPSGVEIDYTADDTAGNTIANANDLVEFPAAWGAGNVTVTVSNDRVITVQIAAAAVVDNVIATREAMIVHFPVSFDGFAGGDVTIDVNGMDTGVTSGEYVIARAIDGEANITALEVETIGQTNNETCGVIRLEESSLNALGPNEVITLTLPTDYSWNAAMGDNGVNVVGNTNYSFLAGFRGATCTADVDNSDDRKLILTLGSLTSTQRGIIEITPVVEVDSDADYGDVEVNVEGDNDVDSTDVVVATYADWGVTVSAEDSTVEDVIAGNVDEELTKLVIEEGMAGSLNNGRSIKIQFPNYVKIRDGIGLTRKSGSNIIPAIANTDIDTDRHYVNFNTAAAKSTSAAEYEIEFNISVAVDAPAGDIIAKVSGSAGAEGEVVLGKVVAPITVTATEEEVSLGASGQTVGDIVIKENIDEAFKQGNFIVQLPEGVRFTSTPKVEVTEGNLDVDEDGLNLDNDDRDLVIEVNGESTKPSTIKISDIKIDLDRTVAFGAIKVKIKGEETQGNALYTSALFENYNEDSEGTPNAYGFDATTAASVVVANLNVAAVENEGTFFIGSTVYSQNGSMKVMDAAPYIKSDRTYVPVRYLAYMLGVTEDNVKYDEATKTVSVKKGDKEVQLVIGSTTIMVNGEAKTMDVAPEITNDRTFLPARYVAEGLGYVVGWNPATQSVVIGK